jgi:phosphate transport system substrate-binding protein
VGKPEITDEIHVYTRSDACGAGEMWAKFSGGNVQDDLKGIGINGEPALVDTVSKDSLGIGYSNLNSVFDLSSGNIVAGIIVPPIDINANGQADPEEVYKVKADAFKAVAEGTYPSPRPALKTSPQRAKPRPCPESSNGSPTASSTFTMPATCRSHLTSRPSPCKNSNE